MVCLFWTLYLFVLLRFTASDYLFSIFKFSLLLFVYIFISVEEQLSNHESRDAFSPILTLAYLCVRRKIFHDTYRSLLCVCVFNDLR